MLVAGGVGLGNGINVKDSYSNNIPVSNNLYGTNLSYYHNALNSGLSLDYVASDTSRSELVASEVVPDVPPSSPSVEVEPQETYSARSVQRLPSGIAVYVTFYSCPPYCGDPSGPLALAEGQAACDPAYMGRRFSLNGSEYVCNDPGGAGWGAHVDLFFWGEAEGWANLHQYGTEGEIVWLN